MNADLESLQRLSESQYADIGKTVHLFSSIEYQLFRTLSAVLGTTEEDVFNAAAQGTFKQRKKILRDSLSGDRRIRPELLESIFQKLETSAELRDQFAHGVWIAHGKQLICKFIKRHNVIDGKKGVALQKIEMPPEKFKRIHRNLEYILIELDVIQEILGSA